MRLVAPLLAALVLAAACGGDEAPRVIPLEDLTNEEMERLVPFDLFPAGLTPLPQEPDHPSVVRPDVPHYVTAYARPDGGGIVGISLLATGDPSPEELHADTGLCELWRSYETGPCPLRAIAPADVGDESHAFAIDPQGPDGVPMRIDVFVRAGIVVRVGTTDVDQALHDRLPALLQEIDRRIEALAANRLGG